MNKNKIIKFEVESSNGTLTDLTSFVNSVEVKPYHKPLWLRLYHWFWWKWFTFKANRAWRKLTKGATLEITFEQRPRQPWRWN